MRLTACCVVALCVALAACGPKDETAARTAAPAPTKITPDPASTPAVDPTPRVVDDTRPVDARVVDVGLSNAAGGPTTGKAAPFAKNDVVHVAIRTDGTASGYTLSAKWLAPDGSVLTEYGQRVERAGPETTDFSLSRPDGWPPGRYTVELAINGRKARDTSFVVE